MPPKRKAAAAKGAGGKKAKKAPAKKAPAKAAAAASIAKDPVKSAVEALKTADKGKKRSYKADALCPLAGSASVYEDYDCMLNQTNIGHNNNKYYVIQVLTVGFGQFYAWNRWGRVGESGQNSLKGPFGDAAKAIADFKKKFKDKTRNDWDKRADFSPSPGKYTLIDMGGDDDEDEDTSAKMAKLDEIDGVKRTVMPCSLDKPTQTLMKLIFDNDMFKEAMASFEIDTKKMPLGKLSKAQIAKGFECLEDIQKAVEAMNRPQMTQLTSKFYTLIPHDFGRRVPPVLTTLEMIRQKMDMLLVLADIELAVSLQKDKDKIEAASTEAEVPHPIDVNYGLLNCGLKHVEKSSAIFKTIDKFTLNTMGHRKISILDVWEVDRDGEGDRFENHDSVGNRKLLWHGTNVAVVTAILKGGLRIMPHSGGRVGKGIYFASENGKSAAYVRCAGNTGIMFLNEVALGKEHHIAMDDWRLTKAPNGYQSIVAKGRTEPDPKSDTNITIEGKKITVPCGKPISVPKFATSSFSQSEYLVYKEDQCRIRYLLKLKF